MTNIPATLPKSPRHDQLQFLRQSARLEESGTPYLVRHTTIMLSLLVFLFIVWASVTPVEEVTQAPGEVVPVGLTQLIQHYDGGIIQNIAVHEGSIVKKGDVLLMLVGAGTQEELEKALIRLLAKPHFWSAIL
jgi:multidrug efflux pump subunit AcrA (membrane-fusion protein)